jgi:hypothetical protein
VRAFPPVRGSPPGPNLPMDDSPMFGFPEPRFMPCLECGASVARAERARHSCEEERRLDYLVLQHRAEVEALDGELAAYLDTPQGRFAAWDAERRRRQEP